MSHEIYHTSAMILSVRNMRESNRLLILYTKDFGLIYVNAQSIREERAKMRFHAQSLSLVGVDLVMGRDMWKLVGMHEKVSSLAHVTSPWYLVLDNLSSLLARLCTGEEANLDIWEDIAWLYDHLHEDFPFDLLEIYVSLRLLFFLGYGEGDELLHGKPGFAKEEQGYIQEHRQTLIQKINEGIQSSQL